MYQSVLTAHDKFTGEEGLAMAIIHRAARDTAGRDEGQRADAALFFCGEWYGELLDALKLPPGTMPAGMELMGMMIHMNKRQIAKAEKSINQLEGKLTTAREQLDTAENELAEFRQNMGLAIADGESAEKVGDKLRSLSAQVEARAAAVDVFQQQLSAALAELNAQRRDSDLSKADDLRDEFDQQLQAVKDAIHQIDLAVLESLPYDALSLAARHGDNARVSANKARRAAAAQIVGDIRQALGTLYRWEKWTKGQA